MFIGGETSFDSKQVVGSRCDRVCKCQLGNATLSSTQIRRIGEFWPQFGEPARRWFISPIRASAVVISGKNLAMISKMVGEYNIWVQASHLKLHQPVSATPQCFPLTIWFLYWDNNICNLLTLTLPPKWISTIDCKYQNADNVTFMFHLPNLYIPYF